MFLELELELDLELDLELVLELKGVPELFFPCEPQSQAVHELRLRVRDRLVLQRELHSPVLAGCFGVGIHDRVQAAIKGVVSQTRVK